MVELLLFLGVICLFFFLPVKFRIFYRKIAWDDTLILEMSFLKGWLKRRKVISLLQLNPKQAKTRQKMFGKWFFYQKKKITETKSVLQGNSRSWREFLQRYQHYGLGMTMFTYFLPAKYQHWLLVVEDLEKKGQFIKLQWTTRFGTGNPVSTAILYGILWGGQSGLAGLVRTKYRFLTEPQFEVIPDFQVPRLDLHIDCIFRVQLGYIIIAAFIARFRHRFLKGGIRVGGPSN